MNAGSDPMPQDGFALLDMGLAPSDSFTQYWLGQAMLRMQRELCWLWHHSGQDRLAEWLERHSDSSRRRLFFAEDATAQYLDAQIRVARPARPRRPARGSLPWLGRELRLSGAELFVLALVMAASRDAAIGQMIACLQRDSNRPAITLALAQWLWGETQELLPLLSAGHELYRLGILRRTEAADEWNVQLAMPALVARTLAERSARPTAELELIGVPAGKPEAGLDLALLAGRIAQSPRVFSVIPIEHAYGTDALELRHMAPVLRRIAALTGRPIFSLRGNLAPNAANLEAAGSYCWLRGGDLFLPSLGLPRAEEWQSALRPFPIYAFTAAREEVCEPAARMLPALAIPPLDYAARRAIWQHEMQKRDIKISEDLLRECAFRFRFDAVSISELAHAISTLPAPISSAQLMAACQLQIGALIGSQASLVTPRFSGSELVLDTERRQQFQQLLAAMQSLSRVHAEWGTARAWGEAGISALFAGAPGTGKTMAAEVLAAELGLPMYRVDLSQVVNKYIGETEKNLRKLFDAAERADIVLFFDEAESLFGQRLETRTANDRFANMEISYLLERMERFRGLAILATNRRKDLDEAFLRRLRYVIEFPLPAETEREAIWRQSVPPQVATPEIDFAFLAHEFALSGGNIRSIMLNACLEAAAGGGAPVLSMAGVMQAITREYEKIGRPLTREQRVQWRLVQPMGIAR